MITLPTMASATRKTVVASAFGGAAETYDADAHLQRLVAARLAQDIAALPLAAVPRLLEIGCGTGFLSHHLLTDRPAARATITDLSPLMVARCRRRLDAMSPQARFLAMDGERPCLRPDGDGEGFDLICSSLALQWFDSPGDALAGWVELLRPGGYVVFATLAAGSLIEWQNAHSALGLGAGVASYPSAEHLGALWPPNGRGRILIEPSPCTYPDGHAFLDGLRRIGARVAAANRGPLSPGALRQVLRRVNQPDGFTVTYQIAYGCFQKDAGRS